jgi:ATP-dependent Clp protease ATP-binding subunit ClpA
LAAPLKRLLQREIETVLARHALGGNLPNNARLMLSVDGAGLRIRTQRARPIAS